MKEDDRIFEVVKFLSSHPDKWFSAHELRWLTDTTLSNLNAALTNQVRRGVLVKRSNLVNCYKFAGGDLR